MLTLLDARTYYVFEHGNWSTIAAQTNNLQTVRVLQCDCDFASDADVFFAMEKSVTPMVPSYGFGCKRHPNNNFHIVTVPAEITDV